jgi:hypothetical protein
LVLCTNRGWKKKEIVLQLILGGKSIKIKLKDIGLKHRSVECYIRRDIAYLIKQYDAKTKNRIRKGQNKLQRKHYDYDRAKIAESCIKR